MQEMNIRDRFNALKQRLVSPLGVIKPDRLLRSYYQKHFSNLIIAADRRLAELMPSSQHLKELQANV